MPQPIDPSAGAGRTPRPALHARLLGPMMVTLRDQRIDTSSSRRTRNVLAYLLLHRRGAAGCADGHLLA